MVTVAGFILFVSLSMLQNHETNDIPFFFQVHIGGSCPRHFPFGSNVLFTQAGAQKDISVQA